MCGTQNTHTHTHTHAHTLASWSDKPITDDVNLNQSDAASDHAPEHCGTDRYACARTARFIPTHARPIKSPSIGADLDAAMHGGD